MAIVVDVARTAMTKQAHNTDYQKGNDNANTPTPTWLDTITFTAAVAETHIGFAYEAGVVNTGDAWVPSQTTEFIE